MQRNILVRRSGPGAVTPFRILSYIHALPIFKPTQAGLLSLVLLQIRTGLIKSL